MRIGPGVRFFSPRARMKAKFFDRTRVMAAVDRRTGTVLSRFGGLVRKVARQSIRPRLKASQPGQPPSSHTRLLKEGIWYAYEPARRSVVIGPVGLNKVYIDGAGQPTQGTVPQTLEQGGQIGILEALWHYRYRVAGRGKNRTAVREEGDFWEQIPISKIRRRKDAGHRTRLRTVTIQARPYMGPAFDVGISQLPGIWSAAGPGLGQTG